MKRPVYMILFLVFSCMASFGQVFFTENAKRVLPHFPSAEGGFLGELILINPSNLQKKIILECYSVEGKHIGNVEFELSSDQLLQLELEGNLPEGTSHAIVSGSQRVMASVTYESVSGLDARSSVGQVLSQFGEVRIVPSATHLDTEFWEGAAVVNVGDSPGILLVDLLVPGIKGPPGRALNYGPMEKRIFLFSDLFEDYSQFDGAYFKISSDQPFAVIGLAGTKDHRIIWPMVPSPDIRLPLSRISESSVLELQEEPYRIIELSLNEEILSVVMEYPQQCEDSLFCIMSGGFLESYPVQIKMTFQRKVEPDLACIDAISIKQEQFDLSPIISEYIKTYGRNDTIMINTYDHTGVFYQQLTYLPQP